MGSSGGAKRKPNHPSGGQSSSTHQATAQHEEGLNITEGKSGLWGFLAGVFVFALIAVPLSAAFSFATHPNTQQLFAGRLDEMSPGGYVAFWWVVTIFLVALPFLVGYAIARLSGRSVAIVGGIIAVFVIAILVMGQMFVF
jgi:amino acid transporter